MVCFYRIRLLYGMNDKKEEDAANQLNIQSIKRLRKMEIINALQVSRKATYISADLVVGCFKCPMSKVRGVVVFWISQGDVVFPNHITFLLIL